MNLIKEHHKEMLLGEAYGLTDKVVAGVRGISPFTQKNNWVNLKERLQVTNRTSAVVKAIKLGIIDLDDIKLTRSGQNLGDYTWK